MLTLHERYLINTNGEKIAVMVDVAEWEALMTVLHNLGVSPAHRPTKRLPRQTLQRALGLLANGHPAPSDEQVAEWQGERRLQKYA